MTMLQIGQRITAIANAANERIVAAGLAATAWLSDDATADGVETVIGTGQAAAYRAALAADFRVKLSDDDAGRCWIWIAPAWTEAAIEARRATGDVLVTATGWCVSYLSGGLPGGSVRLYAYRPGGCREPNVEEDPRHGEIFPSGEAADCYALNAGRLRWFRDWKAEQAAGAATQNPAH